MSKRKIIKIDDQKCTGCGLCIPNCPEGAIQIIDGKARLISDLFCDGLGACLGYCSEGAISIEERNAEEYNEKKVMLNIVRQGENVIKAHLLHLKNHGQKVYLKEALDFLKNEKIKVKPDEEIAHAYAHGSFNCPSAKVIDLGQKETRLHNAQNVIKEESQLVNWPVEIKLVPVNAPYFDSADLLIAADCVPFAYASFHNDFLKGKVLQVGCPKLDDIKLYQDKITQILKNNNIKSVTYAYMEVPCCFGLVNVIQSAIIETGKDIPFKEIEVSIKGKRLK